MSVKTWVDYLDESDQRKADELELEIMSHKDAIKELRKQHRRLVFRGTGRMKRDK